MNPVPQHGKIPSLDGWRAVAIIMVLGGHSVWSDGFPYDRLGWIDRVLNGETGVRMFFVLSGFLITFLLLRETDQTKTVSLRDFYLRRIFRIFPVYFAYLGVLVVFSLLGMYKDTVSSWLGCLTFTRNMMGRGTSATNHFWTLAVEEQFYLVWPVIFALCRLWKRPKLYIGLLAIPMLVCPVVRFNFIVHNHGATILDRIFEPHSICLFADSLAVGCLGAWLAARTEAGGAWHFRYNLLIIFALVVVAAGMGLQRYGPIGNLKLYEALMPTFEAWAFLGLFWLTAHPSAWGHRLLNSWLMRTVGLLSYSIYVWHFMFLGHYMGNAFQGCFLFDWRFWLVPALITSVLSFYFLEKPMMRLRLKIKHQV